MNLVSYNSIILENAKGYYLVKQAEIGDVYDINSREVKYGLFCATPMSALRREGGTITYTHTLYYIDRLTEDESNLDQVQADAIIMLKGLIDRLEYYGQIESTYQFTLFRHQFDDWCAGAWVEVSVIVPDNDCTDYMYGKNVDLRPITITENGVYTPLGFDGFDRIVVSVPGGSDVTKEWVKSEIAGAKTELELSKADKNDVYTKDETDGLINEVRGEIPDTQAFIRKDLDNNTTIGVGDDPVAAVTFNESQVEIWGGDNNFIRVTPEYVGIEADEIIIDSVAFSPKNYYTKEESDTKLDKKLDTSKIWTGSQDEWDELTPEQKASYIIAMIIE